MSNKIAALAAACLGLAAGTPCMAAPVRMEKWGQGVSEFEAVKSAYKQIAAEALKVAVAGAGTAGSSLRDGFTRDIEEDLLRVQRTYFPNSAPPTCTEERERFECLVVAQVEMDELAARLRTQLSTTGKGSISTGKLRIALMPKEAGTVQSDLTTYLHQKLEGDFGHDVYLVNEYIDADALRSDCADYRKLADSYEAKGDSFIKTAQRYRSAYRTCNDLKDRDLIVVLDSAESSHEAFNARERSMAGEIRLRLQFLQTASRRPLTSPRPQAITQYGYGDTAQLAESNLRDRLYDAAANYVSQQMNATMVGAVDSKRVAMQDSTRDYKVTLSGVNPDTQQGRTQVALVRDWFAADGGHPLTADFTEAGFGDRVYRFSGDRVPDWDATTERLQATLDKAGVFARIDVDTSQNLKVTFESRSPQKEKELVSMKVEDKRVKRAVVVESKEMAVRRRDPESGVAIAVNEAVLRIRNKTGRDLLVDVTPVWTGQDGSSLPAPYSYRQTVKLPAKTSDRFAFMAPGKFAQAVSIEISCPVKDCKLE
ncbi:MAG: hypothetical protein WDO68_31175 [Gammaproteobacteria bacterium]